MPVPSCDSFIVSNKDERSEVDETLIDEMLKLSPLERLELHDRMVATARELRRGFEQVRDANDTAS